MHDKGVVRGACPWPDLDERIQDGTYVDDAGALHMPLIVRYPEFDQQDWVQDIFVVVRDSVCERHLLRTPYAKIV